MNRQNRSDAHAVFLLYEPFAVDQAAFFHDGLNSLVADEITLRLNIDERRRCAQMRNRGWRGEEGESRNQNPVARADAERHEREQERVAARGDADRVAATEKGRRFF